MNYKLGFKRIGLLLTAIWTIGFGAYLLAEFNQTHLDLVSAYTSKCGDDQKCYQGGFEAASKAYEDADYTEMVFWTWIISIPVFFVVWHLITSSIGWVIVGFRKEK